MKYLLDTNICIYLIKNKSEKLLKKFSSIAIGEIGISAVTVAELMYGVEKSQHVQRNKAALTEFMIPLEILPFGEEAAAYYGHIRAYLEKKGTPIGPLDQMIAGHALSIHSTLVTHNDREFTRVPHLKVVDWMA